MVDTYILFRTERLVVRTRWSGPQWSPLHGRYVEGPVDVYGIRRHYHDRLGGTLVVTHDENGSWMNETYTPAPPQEVMGDREVRFG